MQAALDLARIYGGVLKREPHGYWVDLGRPARWLGRHGDGRRALRRGLAEYTQFRQGQRGEFPIALRLLDAEPD